MHGSFGQLKASLLCRRCGARSESCGGAKLCQPPGQNCWRRLAKPATAAAPATATATVSSHPVTCPPPSLSSLRAPGLISLSKPAGRLPEDREPTSPRLEQLFTLGPELGKGCFAVCYEATSNATGRTFCAKRIPKMRPRQTAAHCAAAIQSEVRILRQLQHCPEVLQLHSVVDESEYSYIVTELCSGGTLADYLRVHGPMSEAQCAHAMRAVLAAIHACHAAGIEYGDLKPTNVLLRQPTAPSEPLDLCLADFGCSQYVDSSGRAMSSPGTPLFAAPEVMFKRNGLEADLWSAGVLMYHMLSGQWPFFKPEETLSPNSVMRRSLSAPIHWSNFEGISSGAMRLIERMLDREKGSRITAKEALNHPWILEHTQTGAGADGAGAAQTEE